MGLEKRGRRAGAGVFIDRTVGSWNGLRGPMYNFKSVVGSEHSG